MRGIEQADIVTGSGNDTVIATNITSVTVETGDGDDHIEGGTGDDDIKAGAGADFLTGGDGNDWNGDALRGPCALHVARMFAF